MTILIKASSTVQTETPESVTSGVFDVGARSSQKNVGVNESAFCAEKFWSFTDSELNKLVKLGRDSVADFLGETEWELQVISAEAKGEILQMCQESVVMWIVRHLWSSRTEEEVKWYRSMWPISHLLLNANRLLCLMWTEPLNTVWLGCGLWKLLVWVIWEKKVEIWHRLEEQVVTLMHWLRSELQWARLIDL